MITFILTFSWWYVLKWPGNLHPFANESKATQAYHHPFGSRLQYITWTQRYLCPCAQLCALLYLIMACAIKEHLAFQQHPTP